MSYYFVKFGIIGRAKGGSALRRSAYQRCTRCDGFDFSSKAGELAGFGVMLPHDAPLIMSDASTLWRAAEAAEKRIDAQLSRTADISIPNEVPDGLRNAFAEHLLQPFVIRGFAVEWSRHDVDGLFEDVDNPHIHAQITLRRLNSDGFSPKKDRHFNSIMMRNNSADVRAYLADRMNMFFAEHNIDASVSHRKQTLITGTSTYVRKQMKIWKASSADQSVLTCHGIFPPSTIRVRSMERTDDEEGTTDGRTDHWHSARARGGREVR